MLYTSMYKHLILQVFTLQAAMASDLSKCVALFMV